MRTHVSACAPFAPPRHARAPPHPCCPHCPPHALTSGAHARAAVARQAPTAPKPKKEKSAFEKKLEERERREAEEAARKAELRQQMASAGADGEDEDESELDDATAERVRQRKLQEATALDAALDTFGLSAPRPPQPPPAAPKPAAAKKPAPVEMALSADEVAKAAEARGDAKLAAAGSIEDFKAAKEADFEMLGSLINKKLAQYEGTRGHLVCLKALLKAATSNMSPDDTKDLSSFLSVIYVRAVPATVPTSFPHPTAAPAPSPRSLCVISVSLTATPSPSACVAER